MTMSDVTKVDGPHSVLTAEQIADLWEAGFTVIPRDLFGRDVYAHADAIKRPGMAQQWGDEPKLAEYRAQGWRVVVNEAWPGLFAPYGAIGDVSIDRLVLMQKPQHHVDEAGAVARARAHQNVHDWEARQRAAGFTVEIKKYDHDVDYTTREVDGAPTLDKTVGIPRDMMPHISAILDERDWLCEQHASGKSIEFVGALDAAKKKTPQIGLWPLLRSIVLPIAIENVRARLKQGANDGATEKTSNSDRRSSAGGETSPGGDGAADDVAGASQPDASAGGSDVTPSRPSTGRCSAPGL